MEELKKNKYYKLCLWGFIVAVTLHILYAAYLMRGMFFDGSFFMIQMLDNFSSNKFAIVGDVHHPHYLTWTLTQLPVIFANFVLSIHNKYALMMIFTFSQLVLPLIFLFWQYKLCMRTKRIDLYFWSLFFYCVLSLPFNLYSSVEYPTISILILIIINYIISDIDYTKTDIFFLFLLSLSMSVSTELFIFVGPIMFFTCLYSSYKENNSRKMFIKLGAGFCLLLSTLFIFAFMMSTQKETYAAFTFVEGGFDFLSHMLNFCAVFSVFAVLLLLIFLVKKSPIASNEIGIITLFYVIIFFILLTGPEASIDVVSEGQFRTLMFFSVPLIAIGCQTFDILNGNRIVTKFHNYICIILICGIFHCCWQMVDSYYWGKNVKYMNEELWAENVPLYVASEHKTISDFYNPQLRRFIWHFSYTPMSILFSPTYVQKTLLIGYEEDWEPENHSLSKYLYIVPDDRDLMSIPVGATIHIKNQYWDLTDVAVAVDYYNKSHGFIIEF